MFGISAWVVLNPCLIDADSFLTKDIKLSKKLDFRSYVMILSFILSLQILFMILDFILPSNSFSYEQRRFQTTSHRFRACKNKKLNTINQKQTPINP
ncbi:hypothetical protein U063_0691 [Helicobacter pylori BM012A]|uniref:Uncharacterized protein n=1 Tax=Helicobacter pylori BM012S TaxID=1407463 RepID=V5NMG9_HELPX|nr:hypothetical protein U063_0691 [Helicobacter pylori BM012A]AHA89616.1 hypothetical protein U064_0693 [Helicobacter pylori BM012S]AHZ28247.1 hypothetical protein EG66_03645 [Helicobacter pylori]